MFEVHRIKEWAHIQWISEGNAGCVPYTELATYAHIWSSMHTTLQMVSNCTDQLHKACTVPIYPWRLEILVIWSVWFISSLFFSILKFCLRRKRREGGHTNQARHIRFTLTLNMLQMVGLPYNIMSFRTSAELQSTVCVFLVCCCGVKCIHFT